MAQALAFAELVLGGLFLTSALSGEGVGELLTAGLTTAGKERLKGKRSAESGGAGEAVGVTGAVGEVRPGEVAPGGVALPPGLAGSKGVGPQVSKDFAEWRKLLEGQLKRRLTPKEEGALKVAVEVKNNPGTAAGVTGGLG
jgi:hypothetical protein